MRIVKAPYSVKFFLLISVFFIVFYANKINEFPSHIHAWTQSDRYAIALGFLNNNFDFFHPETYNLKPNPEITVQHETGITPVDFPIHEFNIAILMKIFNTKEPWVFRLYVFIYGLIGIYLLGLLVFKITKNEYLGLFFSGFIISCPVFTYYLAGFIPTITSLSSFFIGIYFYTSYLLEKQKKQFLFSILFFTLAALSRLPFAIFMITLLLHELVLFARNKKTDWYKITSIAFAMAIIIAYKMYNAWLGSIYGSGFLSKILPPTNHVDLFILIRKTFSNWIFHYYTLFHYVIIVLMVWLLKRDLKRTTIQPFQKELFQFILISLAGAIFYSIAMATQFPAHDYYFYDSYFPGISVALFLLIIRLNTITLINPKNLRIIVPILIVILIISSFYTQLKRRETGHWDRVEITKNNFLNSNHFLDSIGISTNSKILVIDANTTNAPLILMNRKGYTVLTTSEEKITEALTWNYDFIVLQDEFILSDIICEYPQIINQLTRINGNGKISVYTMDKNPIDNTLESFLGLDEKSPLFISQLKSGKPAPEFWSKIISSTPDSLGNSFITINPENEFGATFAISDSSFLLNKNLSILIEMDVNLQSKNNSSKLVSSLSQNGKLIMYKSFDLNQMIEIPNKWQNTLFYFPVPLLKSKPYELKVYLWNPNNDIFFVDNTKITIFQNQ